MTARLPWLLLFAMLAAPALAQERLGIVTEVATGDRIRFRTPDTWMNVVLAQIEAPALREPWGLVSRESLHTLCYNKVATLMETGTAPDGSTIGKLSCAGVRADEEQIRRGLARVEPPFTELNSVLRSAEEKARQRGLGIWAQETPRGR